MIEKWKPIQGYEGLYSISNQGRVRSERKLIVRTDGKRPHWQERKILKPSPGKRGHYAIRLSKDGVRLTKSVHVLVLETFGGVKPAGTEALHWDDVKSNNSISNLRWGTRSENVQDRIRNSTTLYGKPNVKCPNGHEDFIERADGGHRCRPCLREYNRSRYERLKKSA